MENDVRLDLDPDILKTALENLKSQRSILYRVLGLIAVLVFLFSYFVSDGDFGGLMLVFIMCMFFWLFMWVIARFAMLGNVYRQSPKLLPCIDSVEKGYNMDDDFVDWMFPNYWVSVESCGRGQVNGNNIEISDFDVTKRLRSKQNVNIMKGYHLNVKCDYGCDSNCYIFSYWFSKYCPFLANIGTERHIKTFDDMYLFVRLDGADSYKWDLEGIAQEMAKIRDLSGNLPFFIKISRSGVDVVLKTDTYRTNLLVANYEKEIPNLLKETNLMTNIAGIVAGMKI